MPTNMNGIKQATTWLIIVTAKFIIMFPITTVRSFTADHHRHCQGTLVEWNWHDALTGATEFTMLLSCHTVMWLAHWCGHTIMWMAS
jgi:hypothetical protein